MTFIESENSKYTTSVLIAVLYLQIIYTQQNLTPAD